MTNKTLSLVNGTQHDQTSTPWQDLDVFFSSPSFCPYTAFDPKRSTRDQVVQAWRNLLAKIDYDLACGLDVNGVLLGGYPPVVLGLYQFLSQFRQSCFVAVMGPAPMVEGQRRTFVLQGLRRIPTPRALKAALVVEEGQPLPSEDQDVPMIEDRFVVPKIQPASIDHSKLIYVSARPFTEARSEEIQKVSGVKVVSSAPALPPPAENDMSDFYAAIEEIARLACALKCGVLLDGPPAETLLHVYSMIGHVLPFWYTKTAVVEAGKPAQLVSIDKVPRF